MWYREGTLTLTNGNKVVVGVGTLWAKTENGVLPGMILLGKNGEPYEIQKVDSDTSLTLVEAYAGETTSGIPCRVITTYQGDISQFAARFAAQLHRMAIDSGVIRTWLTSGQEAELIAEDETRITLKSLRQIIAEQEDAMAWFAESQSLITAAAEKAASAAKSASDALASKTAAKESESNSKESEKAAGEFKAAAAKSESNSKTYEINAKASEVASADSRAAAAISESNAEADRIEAAKSATAAGVSENNSKASENSAASFAASAESHAASAQNADINAASSKDAADGSATKAAASEEASKIAQNKAESAAEIATSKADSASVSEANAALAAKRAEDAAESTIAGNQPYSDALTSISKEGEASEANQMMYLSGKSMFALTPLTAYMRQLFALENADDVLTAIGAAKGMTVTISPTPGAASGWVKIAETVIAQHGHTVRIDIGGGSGFNVGSHTQATATTVVVRAGNNNPVGVNSVAYSMTANGARGVATVKTGDNSYDLYLKFAGYASNLVATVQTSTGASVKRMGVLSAVLTELPADAVEGVDRVVLVDDGNGVTALPGALTSGSGATFSDTVVGAYKGDNAFAKQYGSTAAFYSEVTTSGTSEYHPLIKQKITNGDKSWVGSFGWLISSMDWQLQLIDKTGTSRNFSWRNNGDFYAPARLLPGDYSNFDAKYLGNTATAVAAAKLQSARKIAGKSFDGTSDISIDASDVGAFATGSSGTVQGDTGVAWNAKSGMYLAQLSGYSVAIAQFYMPSGSCQSFQLKAHHKNGGLYYRSSRDGYGFEAGFEQIYTTNFKPSAGDVGALSNSGGTLSGQLIVNENAEALILKQKAEKQALYLRGRGHDNSLRWYLGNGGSDDAVSFHNYILNTSLVLNANEVYSNKNIRSAGTLTLNGAGTSDLVIGSGGTDVWMRNTASNKYLQLKDNGVLSYSDQAIYHEGNKPSAGDVGALPISGGQVNGAVTSTDSNGFRITYGGIGSFMRNDGSSTYFLLTNAGDQNGGWNGLRPLHWNNKNGDVTLGHSVNVGGTLTANGGLLTGSNIVVGSRSGSWIDMRIGTALLSNAPVSTNSAAAIVRQEHADRHFILGGLGNSQFGVYMINKNRTANGTDAAAFLGSDGTWTCNGNGNFNDVYIRSDRRNKRFIKKMAGALDKLEKIEGVLYELKGVNGYEQSGGLIAQQVNDVQPELVTADIDHGTGEERLRLNYNGVIGLLVEAVKELRNEVNSLKEGRGR